MKILANDGMSKSGIRKLEDAGFEVHTEHIPQEELIKGINNHQYAAILVRSATQVRKDIIDSCPTLQLIGRGGVGMDNIDVAYAREKGLHVVNTPAASSQSVAELAIGAMFAASRFLADAGRQMPEKGDTDFSGLKKKYGKGTELRGKTLGLIGIGGISKWTARYALGCGMKVIYNARGNHPTTDLDLNIGGQKVNVTLHEYSLNELLEQSDFISLHVPKQKDGKAVIGKDELAKMKDTAIIINTARGGIVDEGALVAALEAGKLRGAFLDVFTNEPNPKPELVKHPKIITTPHIGGSTVEAQDRIGEELADQVIELVKQ